VFTLEVFLIKRSRHTHPGLTDKVDDYALIPLNPFCNRGLNSSERFLNFLWHQLLWGVIKNKFEGAV
jgi:hypothetical protein